jgi:circadian clock protein KaiB
LKTSKSRRATKAFKKSAAGRPAFKYVLRLFVAGATARSRQAVLRVQQLCEAEPEGSCRLEVIDIYQQPRLARDHQIVATPTLLKEFPRPMRRFIGNLANLTDLFDELDLIAKVKAAI